MVFFRGGGGGDYGSDMNRVGRDSDNQTSVSDTPWYSHMAPLRFTWYDFELAYSKVSQCFFLFI